MDKAFLKFGLLVFFLTCFSLTCSNCARSKEEKETITYMMWGDFEELNTVKEYIAEFNNRFPETRVKICHVPQNYGDKLKTMMSAGIPPDVMYIDFSDFHSYAERNVLLDLEPYIENDKEFDLSDFYPRLIEPFEYKNHLYGIPKDFTTLVLYYNRDMFDKENLNYPDQTWTWDDLLETAKKLTRDIDGDGRIDQYGIIASAWIYNWVPLLWQNGGKLMDETRTRWVMGTPEYIEQNAQAIQFFADLIFKYHVAPSPAMLREHGSNELFETGRVGMVISGRWACMSFKNIKSFRWNTAVLPHRDGNRATGLITVCYSIAKQSKNPDAAWKLVKFLTNPEGQINVAKLGHAIPSRKSIATTRFLKPSVLPSFVNSQPFLDSIKYARYLPANVCWDEIYRTLSRELELVFIDREKAKQALINLQPKIEKILAE